MAEKGYEQASHIAAQGDEEIFLQICDIVKGFPGNPAALYGAVPSVCAKIKQDDSGIEEEGGKVYAWSIHQCLRM